MKKTLAIISIVMLASLSVVGCVNNTNTTSSSPTPTAPTTTPTATPTANADYSSYYTTHWQGAGGIVTQPFTKAVNVRGNDIYTGSVKNATLSSAVPVTYVMEHTKSEAQSKQVYDNYVAAKLNEGFSLRSDWVAQWKAEPNISYSGLWIGQNGPQQFYVFYRYNSEVSSWVVTTEAGSY
jgi:hypothetical protein